MVNALLLEDDPNYREIIERVIRRNYSYAVKSVATERQAWEELSKEDFDLVLLDLNIDGRRCWETLKRAVMHSGKPVAIVFSCEDTKANADYALSLGAYTFLAKPFNFVLLKMTIESALRAKHQATPETPGIPEGGDDPPIASPGGLARSGDGEKVDWTGIASSSDPGAPMVLVVGRERKDREPLREVLLPDGFRVAEAPNGPAALDAMKRAPVDIVLMEIDEVAPDALESCRFLRENRDRTKGIPVVAVTGPREEAVLAALRAGADDYFGGPLDGKLLAEKVRIHVRLRKDYERRLEQEIILGFRDPATGSGSPAYFRIRLKEEFERSLRYKKHMTLALLAMSNPEKTKNRGRVLPGDPVPTDPSLAIRSAFRRTDAFGRMSENEFAVLMPETGTDQILGRISDLRERMESDLSPEDGGKSCPVVWVGLASSPLRRSTGSAAGHAGSPEEFFRMAQLAMYKARLSDDHPVAVFSHQEAG